MARFEESFEEAKQQCDGAVNKRFNGDREDSAILLEVARQWRLVEYEYRFGGEQRADYSLGKCGYFDGKVFKDQLDYRKQEQETDQEKYKYRPCRDELTVKPFADRSKFAQDTAQWNSSPFLALRQALNNTLPRRNIPLSSCSRLHDRTIIGQSLVATALPL
jgi:hypothetical protein